MISINRFQEILEDLAEELPAEFYEQLNGGILVDAGHPLHPADERGDLYIMGEYRIDPAMGKYIVMYYGCLLYTSPSPRDVGESRVPSSG